MLSNALSKCMSTRKILTLRTVVLTKRHDNHTTDTVIPVKYLYIVFVHGRYATAVGTHRVL